MPKIIGVVIIALVLLARTATSDPGPGGFWCWIHPDGDIGACGHERTQCDAMLDGVNEVSHAFGEAPITTPCAWQKTAWEFVSKKRKMGPSRWFPKKGLCTRALEHGEACRLVR